MTEPSPLERTVLTVTTADASPSPRDVQEGESITIGRAADCDLVIATGDLNVPGHAVRIGLQTVALPTGNLANIVVHNPHPDHAVNVRALTRTTDDEPNAVMGSWTIAPRRTGLFSENIIVQFGIRLDQSVTAEIETRRTDVTGPKNLWSGTFSDSEVTTELHQVVLGAIFEPSLHGRPGAISTRSYKEAAALLNKAGVKTPQNKNWHTENVQAFVSRYAADWGIRGASILSRLGDVLNARGVIPQYVKRFRSM